jgi:hypothetical protein
MRPGLDFDQFDLVMVQVAGSTRRPAATWGDAIGTGPLRNPRSASGRWLFDAGHRARLPANTPRGYAPSPSRSGSGATEDVHRQRFIARLEDSAWSHLPTNCRGRTWSRGIDGERQTEMPQGWRWSPFRNRPAACCWLPACCGCRRSAVRVGSQPIATHDPQNPRFVWRTRRARRERRGCCRAAGV